MDRDNLHKSLMRRSRMRVIFFKRRGPFLAIVTVMLLTCTIGFQIFLLSGKRRKHSQAFTWNEYDDASVLLPRNLVEPLFISVRTTYNHHERRLPVLLQTWFQLVRSQTWFFTDRDDPEFEEKTHGQLIATQCLMSYEREALCCKMSAEIDMFLESDKKWLCHVNDDNYLNVPRLLNLLARHNPQEDWYLGKPPFLQAPLTIVVGEGPAQINATFRFATASAGFCLSRALAVNMMLLTGAGNFARLCEKIRMNDDVTIGYIIEHLLRIPLTIVDKFHSNLEPMELLKQNAFHEQITFSNEKGNVIKVGGFNMDIDPTRFLSIHCCFFPNFRFCERMTHEGIQNQKYICFF